MHGSTRELRVCPVVRGTDSARRKDVCDSYTARMWVLCADSVCAQVSMRVGREGRAPAGSPP